MDETTLSTFSRLGISLVIGMLVGLQREQASTALAGLRSFALTAVAGTLAAMLDQQFSSGGWVLAASLIALGIVVGVTQWRMRRSRQNEVGMTTVIAILIVYCIGAYLAQGILIVGAAIGVAVATLLQFKPELHSAAHKLGDRDMRAIIQFAVLSCVILPVLPNRDMGPLNVFNPFNIWLMVVLIVGISLAGYIAYKFFGESAGVIVGGLLGGAISSTATSLSYSKLSRQSPSMAGISTAVIIFASSVVFVRVIIELSIVAPKHLIVLGLPMAFMLGSCLVAAIIAWLSFRGSRQDAPEPSNPSEFKSAILFGGLYALVLWALAAVKHYFGSDDALYIVAALSGLTDMDAITLSTGRMVEQSTTGLSAETGWRLLVTASISNLVFKAGIVAVVGGKNLFLRVFGLMLFPIVCGSLLLVFWNS